MKIKVERKRCNAVRSRRVWNAPRSWSRDRDLLANERAALFPSEIEAREGKDECWKVRSSKSCASVLVRTHTHTCAALTLKILGLFLVTTRILRGTKSSSRSFYPTTLRSRLYTRYLSKCMRWKWLKRGQNEERSTEREERSLRARGLGYFRRNEVGFKSLSDTVIFFPY